MRRLIGLVGLEKINWTPDEFSQYEFYYAYLVDK